MKLLIVSSELVDLGFSQNQKSWFRGKFFNEVKNGFLNQEVSEYNSFVVNLTNKEPSFVDKIIKLKEDYPRKVLIINLYGSNSGDVKSILFNTKANLLFSHETQNKTIAYTQDGAEFECEEYEQADLMNKVLKARYYQTKIESGYQELTDEESYLLKNYPRYNLDGRVYGTFASRREVGFITSTRGKSGGEDAFSHVFKVNHKNRTIFSNYKATLNAPLLDKIFKLNKGFKYLIHGHDLIGKVVHTEYEFAGTDGDNKFAIKMKSGEPVLLTHHGFIIGFKTFKELEEYLSGK